MDFFEAQARARRRTQRLVLLFGLAVAGTILASYTAARVILAQAGGGSDGGRHRHSVFSSPSAAREDPWWDPLLFAGVTAGTLAVVGLASVYKWAQFRAGGSAVAESVGARRIESHTADLAERRLLNVVEEMALASGVPVPAVYVMDDEPAINAFAAGLTTSDAAVAVTRGTLERLSRDELQGVIGHEFSHILNGDMRLNLRLTTIIFGILVLGLLGRGLLYGLGRGRVRLGGGRDRGGGVALVIAAGVALLLIGYIGYFFGRLIQAAVSRQREFLADASAVQFTRNPAGLSGALRKIGGLEEGSVIQAGHAQELGHFFFAQGFRSMFDSVWATHPPLTERIRAIDAHADVVNAAAFASGAPPRPAPPRQRVPASAPLTPAAAVASIGVLTAAQVDAAQHRLAQIPPGLREVARGPADAPALVYALLLAAGEDLRETQFAMLGRLAGDTIMERTRELHAAVSTLPEGTRMPLLHLTLPVLRQLPDDGLARFSQACEALMSADGRVSVFEFMAQKALRRHVLLARHPQAQAAPAVTSFPALGAEIALVLLVLAQTSSADAAGQATAFAAGAARLPMLSAQLVFPENPSWEMAQLEAALDRLARAPGPIRQRTLLAAAEVVSADGVILPAEGQLLRSVADVLGCPMPPLPVAA